VTTVATDRPAEMNCAVNHGMRFPKGVVVPVLLIALAEAAFRLAGFRSDSIAPPSVVAVDLYRGLLDGQILEATRTTLVAAFSGLLIGGLLGLTMGVLRATFRRLDQLLEVTTETIRPIPSIAILPVAILIFGFGYSLEISLVSLSCIFTTFILTRAAVLGVDRRMLEVGLVLRLNLWDRMRKLILPAAFPRIFVAFRWATSLSLIVAVTTEIAANPIGLGSAMMMAQQSLNPGLTVAYLVWIGFVGWLLNFLLIKVQRRYFARFSTSALDEK